MTKKRKIQDRKYHYPKGFIDSRTKKKKTGFMPASKGAKIFVKGNFDDIRKGNIPYDSLTTREKSVYRALVSDRNQNTFYFEGRRYFDPTGVIKSQLDKVPRLRDTKNLTNILSKQQFENLFNTNLAPAKSRENLNVSFFEFNKGDKINKHRSNKGNLLDVISSLKKLEKQGFKIDVDGFEGKSGIVQLKDYEAFEIQKFIDKHKSDEPIKVEMLYKMNINPVNKTVSINTNDTQIFEYYQQKERKKQ